MATFDILEETRASRFGVSVWKGKLEFAFLGSRDAARLERITGYFQCPGVPK
jgi:hypothetical protein